MAGRLDRRWAVVLSLAGLGLAGADAPSGFVAESLARPIIGPGLSLVEVRRFAEPKVAPMPEVRDLDDWRARADRMRSETLARVVFRGEAARWRELPTRVEFLETREGGPGYRIRKLRYEAVPGFWIPALLYEPETLQGKVPAVLNFDGHDPLGMFAPYKQVRCINIAKRGMIALNVDWIGMGQLRTPGNQHTFLNHLDLCGTSGLAVFYLLQTRGVDILLAQEHVDPTRIAATGLSGGGWQTIFLGAMDPRVALTAPVAGYSSFRTRAAFGSDLGDSEQTPVDLGTITDYASMTAMLAPRAALLTFNARDDCCFAADHALPPLLEAAQPIYRLFGKQANLRTHINLDPGTHNYGKDNREALYRSLQAFFHPNQPEGLGEEIPSDPEVKTAEQLTVPLPPGNETLQSLAWKMAGKLPKDPTLPTDQAAIPAWQAPRRDRLAEVVRARRYSIQAELQGTESRTGWIARRWALKAGNDWTIPATECVQGDPKGTTLLLLDAGRKEAGPVAEPLVQGDRRVIALDLFDLGESKIAEKAWLWNLYVSTVGDRPLGLQASQLAAIARWVESQGTGPVSVLAIGPRVATIALVAAGLEPGAIQDLELRDLPGSLKEPIESGTTFDKAPDRFCFGLLEHLEIPQLLALAAPRKVSLPNPSRGVRLELLPIKSWYPSLNLGSTPLTPP